MTEDRNDPWTLEAIENAAVQSLPFESLLGACRWHFDRLRQQRTSMRPLSQAEESLWISTHPECSSGLLANPLPASTYDKEHPLARECAALFEWWDRHGVMKAVEDRWREIGVDFADIDGDWEAIEAAIHEIDTEENLRTFLVHMRQACPRLSGEWPRSGPFEVGLFAWHGRESRLSMQDWLLLSFMWHRDKEDLESVSQKVWGHTATDHTISQAIYRVNKVLKSVDCPLKFCRKGGKLTRQRTL